MEVILPILPQLVTLIYSKYNYDNIYNDLIHEHYYSPKKYKYKYTTAQLQIFKIPLFKALTGFILTILIAIYNEKFKTLNLGELLGKNLKLIALSVKMLLIATCWIYGITYLKTYFSEESGKIYINYYLDYYLLHIPVTLLFI